MNLCGQWSEEEGGSCHASPSTLLEEDLRLSSDSEEDSSPVVQGGEVRVSFIKMKEKQMKLMRGNTNNEFLDAKNESFSPQARPSSSEGGILVNCRR